MADEDHYLHYQEFDRVENLRGRPRNTAPFAPEPLAPRSTAPFTTQRESGLAPSIRRVPSQWEDMDLSLDDEEPSAIAAQQDTIVVAFGRADGGQLGGGRARRARAGSSARGRRATAQRRTSGSVRRGSQQSGAFAATRGAITRRSSRLTSSSGRGGAQQ